VRSTIRSAILDLRDHRRRHGWLNTASCGQQQRRASVTPRASCCPTARSCSARAARTRHSDALFIPPLWAGPAPAFPAAIKMSKAIRSCRPARCLRSMSWNPPAPRRTTKLRAHGRVAATPCRSSIPRPCGNYEIGPAGNVVPMVPWWPSAATPVAPRPTQTHRDLHAVRQFLDTGSRRAIGLRLGRHDALRSRDRSGDVASQWQRMLRQARATAISPTHFFEFTAANAINQVADRYSTQVRRRLLL